MEKILDIAAHEARDGYETMSGYKIITDMQVIELLIDDKQSCCESFGYFWCNDDIQSFVGANILGIHLTDTALNTTTMLTQDLGENGVKYEGNVMFVNIDTTKGTLQFVAYNEHNGYYGHEAVVRCAQLQHSEVL